MKKDPSLVLTNKESYEEGGPLGEHEQIKYPNKEYLTKRVNC
jgi:hypothetical protein